MVAQCSHQTLEEIDQRWTDPRTLTLSVEDLTVCPCCCGPAKVGPPIEVSPEGDWEYNGTVLRAYPGFEARLIEPCSRCR